MERVLLPEMAGDQRAFERQTTGHVGVLLTIQQANSVLFVRRAAFMPAPLIQLNNYLVSSRSQTTVP